MIQELIQKYSRSGPRYTSYPTAPLFTPKATNFDEGLASLEPTDRLAAYVHFPFCRSQCYFCGCNMLVGTNQGLHDRYVSSVEEEVRLIGQRLANRLPVTQIHFGGGTPSLMTKTHFTGILGGIKEFWGDVSAETEISIEVHPSVTTQSKVSELAELGFNRISMGIQDFDPVVQQEIRRIQSFEETAAVIEQARADGFLSISVDLVYGLPKSSVQTFQDTLIKVGQLRPSRIALFSYAHVPWLKPYQRFFDESSFPTPEDKLTMMVNARKLFSELGYQSVGMDHFALPEDDLALLANEHRLHRNFMGYTTLPAEALLGVGVSSISEFRGHYFQNQKKLKDYTDMIGMGKLATHRGLVLSRDDQIRRDLIMRLMCRFEVRWEDLSQRWSIDANKYFEDSLNRLHPMAADGLVQLDLSGIRVSKLGELFVRNIAMEFDAYLRPSELAPNAKLFSRTI